MAEPRTPPKLDLSQIRSHPLVRASMSSLATQSSSMSSSTPSPAASTFSSSRTATRSISSTNNNNNVNCRNKTISNDHVFSTPSSYLNQSSIDSYTNHSATMTRKPRRSIDRNKRATISSPIGFRRHEQIEMPSPKPKKSLPNFSISPYTEAPPRDVLYNTEF